MQIKDHQLLDSIKIISCFKCIAVFGSGVIGASVAMGLKKRLPNVKVILGITGYEIDSIEEIRKKTMVDSIEHDPAKVVQNANLVILCIPVSFLEKLIETIAPHLLPDAVVTDTGSVKRVFTNKTKKILSSRFVGGHPMVGSVKSGIADACADLFVDSSCVLTSDWEIKPQTLEIIRALWILLGVRFITIMPSKEHDRMVAYLSHLPHAIAYALVYLVHNQQPEILQNLAGGSYREITRFASSDPKLWSGIFKENCVEVIKALREMEGILGKMASALEGGDHNFLMELFHSSKKNRDMLPSLDMEKMINRIL